jgi:hypothetical protein
MRRIGLVLVILGVIAFVVGTSQRKGYDSVQGAFKATFSQEERGKMELWENARWAGIGLGVIGAVLLVLPTKRG